MKPYDKLLNPEGATGEGHDYVNEGPYVDPKELEVFRRITADIESSNGQNMNHRMMESGIHKGTSAIGTYGVMPNTLKEFSNRLPNPELKDISKLSYLEMKDKLEKDKELEERIFKNVGSWLLDKYGNARDASYAYQHGHNIDPEVVAKRKEGSERDMKFLKRYEDAVKQVSLEEELARQERDKALEDKEPAFINKIKSFFEDK